MPRGVGDKEYYEQSQHHLCHTHIGKGAHALVGNDGRVVRHAEQTQHEGEDGILIQPVGSKHTRRRYGHLGIKEPQSHRFGYDQHNKGQDDMDEQCCREYPLQPSFVSLAQLECKKSPCGR